MYPLRLIKYYINLEEIRYAKIVLYLPHIVNTGDKKVFN